MSHLPGTCAVLEGVAIHGRRSHPATPHYHHPHHHRASREFLRMACIGKPVAFSVAYTNPVSGRAYADVWLLGANRSREQHLGLRQVEAGLASVTARRDGSSSRGASEVAEELFAAQDAAEAGHQGLHSQDLAVRSKASRTVEALPDIARAAADLAGTAVPAIIEQVRDGASLKVTLPEQGVVTQVVMAGVQAPRMNYGSDEKPAPFAEAAKAFVEFRLLHRDVTLKVLGADKDRALIVHVEHPAGDIAVALLKAGLVRVAAWSANMESAARGAALRSAEDAAKREKAGQWREFVAPVVAGPDSLRGVVAEVLSGDTIMLQTKPGAPEQRVSLASVRAPRMGGRSAAPEPWAIESKDFLRRMLIGREVTARVDYTRPVGGAAAAEAAAARGASVEERPYATVSVKTRKGDTVTVNAAVVAAGMGTALTHRADDARARCYEELLAGEEEARAAKAGVHGKPPARARIVDLAADPHKAKEFLPFLQRAGTMKGVVEHVVAGHRLKVEVPAQKVILMMSLSGVKCPMTSRGERAGEPLGDEAAAWTRQHLLQREVELTVEAMDQRGTALAQVWHGHGSGRAMLSTELLLQGLAKTIPAAARRSEYAAELERAEDGAKRARRGVWQDYQEPSEEDAAASAMPSVANATAVDVLSGNCFIASMDNDAGKRAAVNQELQALMDTEGTAHGAVDARPGALVAALYNDGTGLRWYRARIAGRSERAADGSPGWPCVYIDYGNEEVVPASRLRPLPGSPALQRTPALGRGCVLAYVRVPDLDDEVGHAAAVELSDRIMDTPLVLSVVGQDAQGKLQVIAWNRSTSQCVQSALLQAGLARLSATQFKPALAEAEGSDAATLRQMAEAQDQARSARRGMFTYGDVADSDTEPLA